MKSSYTIYQSPSTQYRIVKIVFNTGNLIFRIEYITSSDKPHKNSWRMLVTEYPTKKLALEFINEEIAKEVEYYAKSLKYDPRDVKSVEIL